MALLRACGLLNVIQCTPVVLRGTCCGSHLHTVHITTLVTCSFKRFTLVLGYLNSTGLFTDSKKMFSEKYNAKWCGEVCIGYRYLGKYIDLLLSYRQENQGCKGESAMKEGMSSGPGCFLWTGCTNESSTSHCELNLMSALVWVLLLVRFAQKDHFFLVCIFLLWGVSLYEMKTVFFSPLLQKGPWFDAHR